MIIDEISIKRWLFSITAVLVVVVLCVKAILSASIMYIAGIIVAPLILYFINNPNSLLIAMFMAYIGRVNVPGLWANMSLANVFQFMLLGLLIAGMVIEKRANKFRRKLSDTFLFLFLCNMAVIIYVRGFGVQFLGGDLIGGMDYIYVTAAAGIYSFAGNLKLTQKQILFLLFGNIVAGLLPALVQLAFILSGGRFYILAYFIESSLGYVAGSIFDTTREGMTRLAGLKDVASALLPVALVIKFKRFNLSIKSALIFLCLLSAALSGFRSTLVLVMVIVSVWCFVQTPRHKKPMLFLSAALLGGVVFAIVLFASKHLPPSVQRAVSWVPGVEVSYFAQKDAQASTVWRLEMWKYMLEDIPNYLLVGKGIAFPASHLIMMDPWQAAKPYSAFLVHNYHNGPLQLLLDFGVPGFLFAVLFMFTSCREFVCIVKQAPRGSIKARYLMFLTIMYIWLSISYYLIFGTIGTSFVYLLLTGALMRVISRSFSEADTGDELDGAHGSLGYSPKGDGSASLRQPTY